MNSHVPRQRCRWADLFLIGGIGLVLVFPVSFATEEVTAALGAGLDPLLAAESVSAGEVTAWLEQAEQLEPVDARRALILAEQVAEHAEGDELRLRAQLRIASILRRMGDYEDALVKAEAVLNELAEPPPGALLADTLYLIGRLYWNKTDYATSIEVHLRQLRLDAAFHHLTEALRGSENSQDQEQLAITLNSLGNFHFSQSEYPEARRYHERALKLRRATGNIRGIADSLNNLALIAAATGDVSNALSMLGEAEAIYLRLGLKRYLANVHRHIASILSDVGRHDEALARLDRGLAIAESLGSPEVLMNLYQGYVVTHSALHNFEAALRFEKLRNTTAERIRSEQDRKLINELNARYQAERRENEISLLKRDQQLREAVLRRRQLLGWIVGGGSALAILVLTGAFVFQRRRHRESLRLQSATENARERAEDADRLKSRLLQIASHDLKAPLAALRATARRIETETDVATSRYLANAMRADATRMEVLVRDLLDTTALESSNLRLDYTRFSLDGLVSVVVEQMKPLADSKKQTLVEQSGTDAVMAWADRERVWQVLVNLISNALKFSPLDGAVIVRTASWEEWVSVEVEDNGPGLNPGDIALIYGAPQQLSAQATGGEHSSGLGLSITRELVALHCGRLEVESQPGKGSVFRVLLPAQPPAPSAQPPLQAPTDEGGEIV